MNKAMSLASGVLAAGTTTVVSRKSMLSGVVVVSDGTNVATATVYDNTAASGKVMAIVTATVSNGTNSIFFVNPMKAELGITVVVSGTGTPQAYIAYDA